MSRIQEFCFAVVAVPTAFLCGVLLAVPLALLMAGVGLLMFAALPLALADSALAKIYGWVPFLDRK